MRDCLGRCGIAQRFAGVCGDVRDSLRFGGVRTGFCNILRSCAHSYRIARHFTRLRSNVRPVGRHADDVKRYDGSSHGRRGSRAIGRRADVVGGGAPAMGRRADDVKFGMGWAPQSGPLVWDTSNSESLGRRRAGALFGILRIRSGLDAAERTYSLGYIKFGVGWTPRSGPTVWDTSSSKRVGRRRADLLAG